MIVGQVNQAVKQYWQNRLSSRATLRQTPGDAYQASDPFSLVWAGLAAREQIPALDRAAHLLYSSDINAACPNSVIEALACGLPVAAFDTGALPELVTAQAGCIAPYGGDPWRLDPPDVNTLANRAVEILLDQPRFRRGARQRAEAAFGLDQMVKAYLDVLFGS
jgi:glycosyltransferase involved in cell wall biosynthesis